MEPRVSVVVSCYNYGNYIARCLKSIQNQTIKDFEVIIVDDGSTDNTQKETQALLLDSRFRYIRQVNGGQANAKNRGIRESQADLIAFLDADDLWEVEKLEKQLNLFKNPDVGVVYSRARLIDDQGNPIAFPPESKFLRPRRGRVTKWLFIDNFLWFSSTIVRRKCLSQHGTFDESIKMGIDWDLWLRISTNYEFDFVDEPLISYRVGHCGQMSKNKEIRQLCSDLIMKDFLDKYPGEIDNKTRKIAKFHTYCSRGEHFRNINIFTSYKYYLKALTLLPLKKNPYKGILKNLSGWTK